MAMFPAAPVKVALPYRHYNSHPSPPSAPSITSRDPLAPVATSATTHFTPTLRDSECNDF